MTREGIDIGRPNSWAVDILEHIARVLPLFLNPVIFQFCKSQNHEEEGSGGVRVGASFQPTPHLTSAEQQSMWVYFSNQVGSASELGK